MKGNLAKKFETVRNAIMHEPMLPHGMHYGRLVLVEIMRTANAAYNESQAQPVDVREFNPASLSAQDIEPKTFMETMARIYAHETLGQYDNQSTYEDVLFNRCNKSLDTSHEYAHGHFLPDDVKYAIHKKMEKNGFVCAYPPAHRPS